jgi:hypothetical protein
LAGEKVMEDLEVLRKEKSSIEKVELAILSVFRDALNARKPLKGQEFKEKLLELTITKPWNK